jgi:peptidoglycan/LPS O-acetylase OafA/YrhL
LWDHPQIQSLDGILLPLAVVAIGQIEIVRNWRLPDWSYGFYLWAWPVQQCLVEKFPSMSPVRMVVMSTLCTLPAAALSWILVERPFLSLRSPAV